MDSPDTEVYEDKEESIQSTLVEEDEVDLSEAEFELRIEQIEMSSDYQNIMALLLKNNAALQDENLQDDSEAEDEHLSDEAIALF